MAPTVRQMLRNHTPSDIPANGPGNSKSDVGLRVVSADRSAVDSASPPAALISTVTAYPSVTRTAPLDAGSRPACAVIPIGTQTGRESSRVIVATG